jgi:hypothetical protein
MPAAFLIERTPSLSPESDDVERDADPGSGIRLSKATGILNARVVTS